MFHRVEYDDVNFVIRVKHGASLVALGEKIKVRVVATGSQTSKVVVESGNQFPLNIFNIGQNKQNVTTLTEFIANRVYRLCSDEEIRLREPDIRIKHWSTYRYVVPIHAKFENNPFPGNYKPPTIHNK